MRTIAATVYSSLDGVTRNPEKWSLNYFTDEAAAHQTELLARSDVLLQGRVTYDSFAQFWNEPSDDAYNQRMYEVPKVLVSRTRREGAWNNTTVAADPVAAVADLKQGGDGLVLTYGFGAIAYSLLDAGLLDELHVWVHPVLVRDASPEDLLFRPGSGNVPLRLVETTALATGVNVMHLAVERG